METEPELLSCGIYPLVISHSHGIDGPFIDGLPIKTSIYEGFSMAMSYNQRVYFKKKHKQSLCSKTGGIVHRSIMDTSNGRSITPLYGDEHAFTNDISWFTRAPSKNHGLQSFLWIKDS